MPEALRLYEALLHEPDTGYFLLEAHLARLARSAQHFGFALDAARVRRELERFARRLPPHPRKVRLELGASGDLFLQDADPRPALPVRAALAREPVQSSDEFLRHKTSRRDVYARALAAHPEADDVVLWNERGELTESCSANLVLELDGRRLTPPVSCGLLPGTYREHLLARGELEEAVVTLERLAHAGGLWLVNSVRRWCPLEWLPAVNRVSAPRV
jgi:para-aminobenzoate synthetase/4-amino-4-deoxychorismate lyase